MKEALRVDLNGYIVDVELADDSTSGIMPIYETPEPSEEDEQPEDVLVGYVVYERCPDGLYKPKFDIEGYQTALEDYDNALSSYSEALREYSLDPENGEEPELPALVYGEEFWVEGLSQEEIDAIRNAPRPETDSEKIARLEEENAVIALELIDTQIRLEQSEREQASLLLELVEKGVI